MVEFKLFQSLYKLLAVLNLPSGHWCDNNGCVMALYMYKNVVQDIHKLLEQVLEKANFVAITVDEASAIDTGSYLSVHCYIVCDWIWVPLLVALQRVDCAANAKI